MALTYEEALAAIDACEGRPWRSGLDRMRAFVERAGLVPALEARGYIHIAGTNGKGTTTAFVESILRHQGWRTGAFYSPYVVDYRERIQAEGRMVEPQELAALAERLLPIAGAMDDSPFGGATKFELETAMGLAYWEQKACEWVALEVGLGGRLDATNVVTPRACIITSIGLDHTAILGNTLQEIAAEKAGIIKPGVPVVVGALPKAAEDVVGRIALERNAPLWLLGREIDSRLSEDGRNWKVVTPKETFERWVPASLGLESPSNAALAVAACVAAGAIRDPSHIREGVQSAWLPGRFERRTVRGREVIFDGAHNADAARALVRHLGPKVALVTNMVMGHEVEAFYRPFQKCAVRAEVAPIAFSRALTVEQAVAHIRATGIPARGHASVAEALEAALEEPGATVVVTGSNYLVGEALRLTASP